MHSQNPRRCWAGKPRKNTSNESNLESFEPYHVASDATEAASQTAQAADEIGAPITAIQTETNQVIGNIRSIRAA
ncbi:hypothetical protein [Bradyrhizobium guangxiense]|uniref:hypothetical protein n=1 Tax=Bradyrhizobium guangxiense TaxID=1325115 RepID=UPI001008888D|nr:hypothetical protein [Bradyrhizobium guangxiense]